MKMINTFMFSTTIKNVHRNTTLNKKKKKKKNLLHSRVKGHEAPYV